MIYNEELFEIEDTIDALVDAIVESDLLNDYKKNHALLTDNQEVQELMSTFLKAKDSFEKIESYGKFAPDFKEKRRALRKVKRTLDTNDIIAEFKYSETSYQNMLDYICLDIAETISENIKVDAGNPFFEFAKTGCGGTCHVN